MVVFAKSRCPVSAFYQAWRGSVAAELAATVVIVIHIIKINVITLSGVSRIDFFSGEIIQDMPVEIAMM
jgi:hypothetical protein